MSIPSHPVLTLVDPEEVGRLAVLQHFETKEIQHLAPPALLIAQNVAGHGDKWGLWQTPKEISPTRMPPSIRIINIAQRLRDYLSKEPVSSVSLDLLIDEGVLQLTRLALITRLVLTSDSKRRRNVRHKPSTIAQHLYQYWPEITARAIRRKAEDLDHVGLIGCLTDGDVRELKKFKATRIELERLENLVALGVWSDVPRLPDIAEITDPFGPREPRAPQRKTVPHEPIPDEFMAAIGPRVLWVIRDLGPNLLRLVEAMQGYWESVDWSVSERSIGVRIEKFIFDHQELHPWKDCKGYPLAPPFPLATGVENCRGREVDRFEWPARTWSHIKILSLTLQAAHLFISLLACAGRAGEVATLKRDCVVTARDGKDYLGGYTYKLSRSLFGEARQWPAPDVLVRSLGQQARLAAAWDRLPQFLTRGMPDGFSADSRLWVCLSTSGGNLSDSPDLNFTYALKSLAKRVGMDPKPGGKNLHAHRLRKTIGRLAGIAMFNSPLVLKRLFGHKSIEMTLHYILCDPDIRTEAEMVLRELRIMHCADALEEIYEAMANGAPLPGNGGPGGSRLVQAVVHERERLTKLGRGWNEGSAYDLAFFLTAQGHGWRLIREDIVCSKAPGENGICQQKRSKGEPNTSNCKPECDNRIVLMRHRRDIEAIVEQYLDIARQAKEDGQLLVLAHAMDNLREELESFSDLKEKYLADREVKSLLDYCEELGA